MPQCPRLGPVILPKSGGGGGGGAGTPKKPKKSWRVSYGRRREVKAQQTFFRAEGRSQDGTDKVGREV